MHQLHLREHAHVHAWLTSEDRHTLVGAQLAWCLQVLGYAPHIGVLKGSPVSVIFHSHEDLISFTLAWSNHTQTATHGEAAAFYCPYIPLTMSPVIVDPDTFEPVVQFNTQ